VGRGIVLDVRPALTARGDKDVLGTSAPITVTDLETTRARTGLSFGPGDIMLVHTGFVAWYETLDRAQRHKLIEKGLHNAGLERSEEMAAYLWDQHISALAMDNVAIEEWPPDRTKEHCPFGFLHQVLIGEFGMALGELWRLSELVDDCQSDGVFECLVVSAPLASHAGIGSPANAVAVK
jgi:kynurenine formamidase